MATLKLDIQINDSNTISTKIKVDDVGVLFEKLVTQISKSTSSVNLDNVIFKLTPPIELLNQYKESKLSDSEFLLKYLGANLHSTDHDSSNPDAGASFNNKPVVETNAENPVLPKAKKCIKVNTGTAPRSPLRKPKQSTAWGSSPSGSDTSEFGPSLTGAEAAPRSPLRKSKQSKAWGSSPSGSDTSESGYSLTGAEAAPSIKRDIPEAFNYQQILDSLSDININDVLVSTDKVICELNKSRNKLNIHNYSKFSMLYDIYHSKTNNTIEYITENKTTLLSEFKELRKLLLKYKGKLGDSYKYYQRLWNFAEILMVLTKSIKLYPCKNHILTGQCTIPYCSYFHIESDAIYSAIIPDNKYVATFDQRFINAMENVDMRMIEDFICDVYEYLFDNTICRYKNNCWDPNCKCVHNIHEQLTVYHKWELVWKPTIVKLDKFRTLVEHGHVTILTDYIINKKWDKEELYNLWRDYYGS
tara:strand:- start:213 stop:1631 length:1419 start_codon:yes stop_codon:yes gene_type:complete